MDDFIDDTELDDLQRKDIEETLRLINPRYDKKKWKMREMMIDDRRMDARFRDIETEERHSTRMGLIEDLKEAKKGSKSIG
ncbi:SPT2 chromatin protein domain-containing protein [Ditylenchus destructor]|uniref:SPT2 chromatin protein domain-containing protein n=1 Tax=Ditylenchus destructor TaxID=166010 RepID=A0AAD4N290_9BILA|nr:SPT2 chromatin protein domain-containing protein [Ditylenchus destructor]